MTPTRFALALLIATGCGGGKSSPSTTTPPAPACTPYEQVKVEEKAVADRNLANLRRALSEQGMREPDFPADYYDARDDQGQEWQLVDAAGARTLLAPVSYLSCDVSNPWHLGQDGSGAVFALMITPRETARKVVTICGCESAVRVTCDGTAKQPVRWRWAMATSAPWKGPLNIVVDTETLSTAFECR